MKILNRRRYKLFQVINHIERLNSLFAAMAHLVLRHVAYHSLHEQIN